MSRSMLQRAAVHGYDAIGVGIDPVFLWMLRSFHFPSARLWAAANAAADHDAFVAGLPDARRRRATNAAGRAAFNATRDVAARTADATAAWREVVLEGGPGDACALETERRRAATGHLATAAPLRVAIGRRGLTLVKWDMQRQDCAPPPPTAFAAPADLDAVVAGPEFREGDLMRQWLSAPAETATPGDRSMARMSWPASGIPRCAIVVGSGVGVEWDQYVRIRRNFDFPAAFCALGFAVIEIVSPGHGLRRAPDRYGGEIFFAGAPISSAALLVAQCRETARMVAWLRARWDMPTGLFGLSMSSFVAQLALTHSAQWPDRARPDGGFLMGHSGELIGVVRGRLAGALGIERALREAGWTEDELMAWGQALAPGPAPMVPPGRIVSMIGYRDRVTPFRDGAALTKAWGLPPENQFHLPHGHLGLPTRLLLEPKPIARFAEVLTSA